MASYSKAHTARAKAAYNRSRKPGDPTWSRLSDHDKLASYSLTHEA